MIIILNAILCNGLWVYFLLCMCVKALEHGGNQAVRSNLTLVAFHETQQAITPLVLRLSHGQCEHLIVKTLLLACLVSNTLHEILLQHNQRTRVSDTMTPSEQTLHCFL